MENNSPITSNILMKLHVHHHTMGLYIQDKIIVIQSIGYLVMAENEKIDGRPTPNLYLSVFCGGGGGKKEIKQRQGLNSAYN